MQKMKHQRTHYNKHNLYMNHQHMQNNEATGSILHEIQTQPLNNTSTHTNITLDINQMSHLINTPEMCDGRTPGHATEGQFQSQLISDSQLITNIEHQPDDGTNTTPVEFPLTEFINAQIIQESEERPPLDGLLKHLS
ncbi:uncharacterized protein LOC112572172 [Pomacea canaliculata]|uniref:uncharacterized protein LOC112572172 n=1 Tax=Pomacea canaliculata TaxID=400727 RepID=UPI000D72699A|nr:uncharacterized protein LOC112572172 [Pomacea canaliculata]